MAIPRKIDREDSNNKFPTNKKVIELADWQKPGTSDKILTQVSCLLGVEACAQWHSPSKYPLPIHSVLTILGLSKWADVTSAEESESIQLKKFREKNQKKKSFARYREKITLISSLQKSHKGSLVDELQRNLEKIYTYHGVDLDNVEEIGGFFQFVENYFKKWYFTPDSRQLGFVSCSVAFKVNFAKLKNCLRCRLDDLVSFGEADSLNSSGQLLEELEKIFLEIKQDCLYMNQKYLLKEKANLDSYNRSLSVLLDEEEGDLDKVKKNWEIAKNTLFNQYKYKIEAKTYSLAVEEIEKILELSESYLNRFRLNQSFLAKIRANLLAKAQEQSSLVLPFSTEGLRKYLQSAQLLKIIEKKIGHSLSSFGVQKKITEEMVMDFLLEETKPIAQKICVDIYAQLQRELS